LAALGISEPALLLTGIATDQHYHQPLLLHMLPVGLCTSSASLHFVVSQRESSCRHHALHDRRC